MQCQSLVQRQAREHSGNRRGAKTAAILYSLIETAKLNACNLATYLCEAAAAAIQCPAVLTNAAVASSRCDFFIRTGDGEHLRRSHCTDKEVI